MNTPNQQIILSIETTVEGGSISLLEGEREIDFWLGKREVSKAEDVLEQILEILKTNKIDKKQISLLVVSKEENSTGGKIGAAIAKGLAKAIKCRLIEVSILESLLQTLENEQAGIYLSAVPVGKSQVKWQYFRRENNINLPLSEFGILPRSLFIEKISEHPDRKTVTTDNLKDFVKERSDSIFTGQKLSKLNALSAIEKLSN